MEGGDYFTSSVNGTGKGLNVTIEHADGSRTTYAHLSRILFRDPLVKAGDIIGYAGSTGDATGTHLHFEVIRDGKAVDPGEMKPIQSIELTVRGNKVYHDRMLLDLEKNDGPSSSCSRSISTGHAFHRSRLLRAASPPPVRNMPLRR